MAKIDRERKMRIAAYLRGMLHLTEAQIGIRMGGISTTAVNRLLREAKETGLLLEEIVYSGKSELSAEDDAALCTLTFQSELHSSLADRMDGAGSHKAPRIYLYDLSDLSTRDGIEPTVAERMHSFAERAAPELRRLLTRPSVKTIGVAWGGGIAAIVDALVAEGFPARAANPVTVLALCGEPLDRRPTRESSAAIAENLSLALNGTPAHAKTLGITPAYIPASESAARDVIWRHIVATPLYLEVLGAGRIPASARPGVPSLAPPQCESMHAFLTSASTEGRTLGYGAYQIVRPEFLDPQKIARLMYGDIGGIPLPRPNLSPAEQEALREYENNWTGVTRRHVQACFERGFDGHPTARPPGCILVAVGEQKARTVYQAVVHEGLVNHLFIDHECAQALERLLEQPSG